jgi:hypothetical protein
LASRFKIFEEGDKNGAAVALEKRMNEWIAGLSATTKVKRTQFAANEHRIYALVNYDEEGK